MKKMKKRFNKLCKSIKSDHSREKPLETGAVAQKPRGLQIVKKKSSKQSRDQLMTPEQCYSRAIKLRDGTRVVPLF